MEQERRWPRSNDYASGFLTNIIVTKLPFYELWDETAHYTASVAEMGSIR